MTKKAIIHSDTMRKYDSGGSMRKIAIVGAGQSGLQLALGLLQYGYDVTLISDKTPEDLLKGKVLSSQCMFNNALNIERHLGLDFWCESVPPLRNCEFNLIEPIHGEIETSFQASFHHPAASVDQRLKNAMLMNIFIKRGGKLRIRKIALINLNLISEENDLVIVATGRGALSSAFPENEMECRFNTPQRELALTYLNPSRPISDTIRFTLAPEIGELVTYPALTLTGLCNILVFEGVPGGPMDCWKKTFTPDEHLKMSLDVLRKWFPEEYPHFKNATLTDDKGYMSGHITPCVRHPVITLPSGKCVLGMGDTVVVNDSLTGQGANSAAKCAHIYLTRIMANSGEFDRQWMEDTFNEFWCYVSHVVTWTNSFFSSSSSHLVQLIRKAATDPDLASQIVNGFDDPTNFFPWWFE